MIRPEAKAQIWRWREGLAGAASLVLGLWFLSRGGPVLLLPAIALMLAGAALIWIGLQRGRFRGSGLGPGAVRVDEGQIAYFGPITGGVVALRDVTEVAVETDARPAHWRLQQNGNGDLMIPVNAEGVEALFDAFATLPGFRMARALKALQASRGRRIVVWRRDRQASDRILAKPPQH